MSVVPRARHAKVAELADALDLGSSGETRESSSLSFRTRSISESKGYKAIRHRVVDAGEDRMEVSLSETGGLSRRLEVAVPGTEVAKEVQERLKRLSRTARLKGFRPGKAPLAVIAKQFGDQVRAEVVSDLMRSSFAQAVNQQNLRPAGGPRIEPIALGPDTDLKYAAHFEVLPEIKINAPETIAIEKPAATVTEADVDSMIENMRGQRPVFTRVERAAREGDRVLFDYQARIGGRLIEEGDLKDVRVVLGTRQAMP